MIQDSYGAVFTPNHHNCNFALSSLPTFILRFNFGNNRSSFSSVFLSDQHLLGLESRMQRYCQKTNNTVIAEELSNIILCSISHHTRLCFKCSTNPRCQWRSLYLSLRPQKLTATPVFIITHRPLQFIRCWSMLIVYWTDCMLEALSLDYCLLTAVKPCSHFLELFRQFREIRK